MIQRPLSIAARLSPAIVVGLALLSVAPLAWAQQAKVTATLDRRSCTTDDQVTLTITAEGEFDQLEPPSHPGLEVVDSSTSQRFTMVNSSFSRQKVIRLTLAPKKPGVLEIGAAKALRGSSVVATSSPLKLVVKAVASQPPATAADNSNLAARAREPYFLHASTDRSSYYVGEPFVVYYTLYWQPSQPLTSAQPTREPKLEGLLVEELDQVGTRSRPRDRRVAGRRLRYVHRAVKLAVPLSAGEVVIDEMATKIQVGRRTQTIRSRPFKIEIKPLPTEGRPESFRSGNVGRYTLAVELGEGPEAGKAVKTGERLILTATVSGSGNLVTLQPPVVAGDESFEVQQLSDPGGDEVLKDAQGMHGSRRFQYLLTPLKPGEHRVPRVTLSYFEPRSGVYNSLDVEGQLIKVEGAALAAPSSSAAAAVGEDIGPLIERASLESVDTGGPVESVLFWLFLAFPFAGFVFIEARYRAQRSRDKDPIGRRSKGAHGNANKRLRAAEQAMRDGLVKDFFGQISRTLTAYFEERANLPATGMTHDELREAAVAVGYPVELVEQVIVEMENCDFARFAPSGSVKEQMKESLERADGLIEALDKVKPRIRS